MKNRKIHISKTGAYLFGGDTLASVKINYELLVVLTAPDARVTSIVLVDNQTAPKLFIEMLNNAFSNLLHNLDYCDTEIYSKLFGASHGTSVLLSAVNVWLAQQGMKPIAKDLGRHVARNILIECGSGRVGVVYACGAQSQAPELMTVGTAKGRSQLTGDTHEEVLILAKNPVKAVLTKQAIEEHEGFSAVVVDDVKPWLLRAKEFPWRWVLSLDDWGDSSDIFATLEKIQKKQTGARILWCSETDPTFLKDLRNVTVISPLVPEFLNEFKSSLSSALQNTTFTPLQKTQHG